MSELMSKECAGTPVGAALQNPAVLVRADGAGDTQSPRGGPAGPGQSDDPSTSCVLEAQREAAQEQRADA